MDVLRIIIFGESIIKVYIQTHDKKNKTIVFYFFKMLLEFLIMAFQKYK